MSKRDKKAMHWGWTALAVVLGIIGVVLGAVALGLYVAHRGTPDVSGELLSTEAAYITDLTTTGTAGTWTKLAGFDTSQYLQNMLFPVNGRLTYTGNSGAYLKLDASLSITTNTSATALSFVFAINGVATADGPMVATTYVTAGNSVVVPLQTLYQANHNDYFEIFALSTNLNTTVTLLQSGSSFTIMD